jgi:hypothetical protein
MRAIADPLLQAAFDSRAGIEARLIDVVQRSLCLRYAEDRIERTCHDLARLVIRDAGELHEELTKELAVLARIVDLERVERCAPVRALGDAQVDIRASGCLREDLRAVETVENVCPKAFVPECPSDEVLEERRLARTRWSDGR